MFFCPEKDNVIEKDNHPLFYIILMHWDYESYLNVTKNSQIKFCCVQVTE